ncbi:hypothetical protein IAC76_00555 [Spirochaetes bacterium]|uniref:Transmembrane protein n=1 Tax=Candidatus Scatousia excrementipullorum TaxID=2840936 RepID=A0A9D9DMK6_9BACT|nr:hypothetical protein [Candidatus Scatousia excrementipullorum]
MKGGGTECRRVLRKVRKPWFLLTRFFWSRVFFSFVYFFIFLVVGIKRVFTNAPPAHCRRVLGYTLCRQSAFSSQKKEKKQTLNNVFIDEKIPLLFPL